jgi:uncharacterized membrane protein
MKQRIWELDAIRGFCLFFMFYCHIVYDLTMLFQITTVNDGGLFEWTTNYTGIIFITLSGICATFSGRTLFRGAVVFGCGLLCSAVTVGMYLLGFTGTGFIIYFGVLHCLGICMVVWPAFKKLPNALLLLLSAGIIALGLYISANVGSETLWLLPFGLVPEHFTTSDFFPLLPNLGYFLLGSFLGKTLYRHRQTLLPGIDPCMLPLRFLRLCGKHSLLIYLLHQPVLTGICFLLTLF